MPVLAGAWQGGAYRVHLNWNHILPAQEALAEVESDSFSVDDMQRLLFVHSAAPASTDGGENGEAAAPPMPSDDYTDLM